MLTFFPGTRKGDFVLDYPDAIDLSDTTHHYYYNWGKLKPFQLNQDKYFASVNKTYAGSTRTVTVKHELKYSTSI